MVIVPHPPYSPDLGLCDFTLFSKLKMKLKGRRFETVSDIQRESQVVLYSIKENDFHGAFEAWKKQWDRCISSQGDYLRRWQPKLCKLSQPFFFYLVREFPNSTFSEQE
jgi:hypothetical protein